MARQNASKRTQRKLKSQARAAAKAEARLAWGRRPLFIAIFLSLAAGVVSLRLYQWTLVDLNTLLIIGGVSTLVATLLAAPLFRTYLGFTRWYEIVFCSLLTVVPAVNFLVLASNYWPRGGEERAVEAEVLNLSDAEGRAFTAPERPVNLRLRIEGQVREIWVAQRSEVSGRTHQVMVRPGRWGWDTLDAPKRD